MRGGQKERIKEEEEQKGEGEGREDRRDPQLKFLATPLDSSP